MSAASTAIEVLVCAAFGVVCGLVAYLVMRALDILSPSKRGDDRSARFDVPRADEFHREAGLNGDDSALNGTRFNGHRQQRVGRAVESRTASAPAGVRQVGDRGVFQARPAHDADCLSVRHEQSVNPISSTWEVQ